ncbi:cell division protein FtsQ/DivIB [Sunxiuqinia sp. sy24]|uniref:cell division protein FtsQ/DivIB n=1 Tax=Sunxiuqinia sp. sy24 TaxID=3461495 RepID=UPI004045859E
MFNSVMKIGFLGLLVVVVAITMAFSSGRLAQVGCQELIVLIDEDSPRFIDEQEIMRLVKKADSELFDKKLNDINTEELEKALKKETAIKNIEIYRRAVGLDMDFKGKLIVEVEQRDPVVRIRNDKEDFYLDKEGVRISASGAFTSKVLLVSGQSDEKYAREKLLPLVSFIHEDEFWNAQVEQIQVNSNGELIMSTLVGDQLIEFGRPADFQVKLRNLKALYEQAFSTIGWDQYSKINLKYTNQVVCTKK